jgi:CubicO group peptidase (beta-lactamase class C family)
MVDTLAKQPLAFSPGRGWEYDNSGYLLAAALVEKAAGMPLSRYMHERIFQPVGMSSTRMTGYGTEDAPGRARSYTCSEGRWERADYTPLEKLYGAVGMVSTLEDLGRWYAALDASSLLPPEIQQEAFRTGYLEGGQPTDYGFGWVLASNLGTERHSHGGWWKGFRNISLRYPEHGLTVVILSNDAGFAPLRNEMAFRTARVYLRELLAVPGALPGVAQGLARLRGTYVTRSRQEYRVEDEAGALSLHTPAQGRLRLLPLADGSFYVAGNEEERYTFVPEPSGTAMRMLRMEIGLGGTVRTWTVAYRR